MVGFPNPGPGLVVAYSYLWSSEAKRGQVEGRKDRPCAIVLALTDPARSERRPRVIVVPITHIRPRDPTVAVEIPARVKAHLGLDGEQSWIMVDEFNVFVWPGGRRHGHVRHEHAVLHSGAVR